MAKCCYNTENNNKNNNNMMAPAPTHYTKTNSKAWMPKSTKSFSHYSCHRYFYRAWVGFAPYLISSNIQWRREWHYWACQNAHAVKITLKLWYKSIFSFHLNIQNVSSYLCYILLLHCERWQIPNGKSNQAMEIASWDRAICSLRAFFSFNFYFYD